MLIGVSTGTMKWFVPTLELPNKERLPQAPRTAVSVAVVVDEITVLVIVVMTVEVVMLFVVVVVVVVVVLVLLVAVVFVFQASVCANICQCVSHVMFAMLCISCLCS